MKFHTIVLAGGSGYLGSVLANYYRLKARSIIILGRKRGPDRGNVRQVAWNGKDLGPWVKELEGSDLLVNLCGRSVNCRYNERNRREILESRVDSTNALGLALQLLDRPPAVWLNAASATIYREAMDRPQDEAHGETGTGFSVEVCRAWEAAFLQWQLPRTRKVVLRTGMVMGAQSEVIEKLSGLARCGLGGRQGSGDQYVSWLHEEDFARITEWAFHQAVDGSILNCSAPGPLRNRDLMQMIRRQVGVPFGLPVPELLLKIGAVLIGTETELVLKSRWVYPSVLLEGGFEFLYPEAAAALSAIIRRRR